MYKPINGWTKERILEVLRNRPFEKAAQTTAGKCVYLALNGNKCGVGMFIPDGHDGQKCIGDVSELVEQCPDLVGVLPLDEAGLTDLQTVHDLSKTNAKSAMIAWAEKNIAD